VTWRDNYKRASFRGVPFHARSVERTYGRRLVVSEYPNIEKPYVEDMGRAYDDYSFEGYVIGDDYQDQLQALIKACRDIPGPGRLVDPYTTEISARCSQLRTREDVEEGGMCRFFIAFFEEGELRYPSVATNPKSIVFGKSQGVIDAVSDAFSKAHKVSGYIGFVRETASAQVRHLSDFLGALSAPLNKSLDEAFSFSVAVDKLRSDAVALVNTPAKLATRVASILGQVKSTFAKSENVLASIIEHYSATTVSSYTTDTPSRKQEAANTLEFQALIRRVTVAERAQVAVSTTYPTYQDAYISREAIVTQLDLETEIVGTTDEVYLAIAALITEVINGVPAATQQLPQLRKIALTASLPAIVVAYQLYKDATRESEIVTRNHIRHPGFMPGGVPLEVVVDGG